MFQPTPTHGGRRHRSRFLRRVHQFQPTPTHGGRPVLAHRMGVFDAVSTHAHARWATRWTVINFPAIAVSTHAHARWATLTIILSHMMGICFNPRPRTVGDIAVPAAGSETGWFQPTPTHGGRHGHIFNPFLSNFVSTHAHARWATRSRKCRGCRPSCFNPRPRTVGDATWMAACFG